MRKAKLTPEERRYCEEDASAVLELRRYGKMGNYKPPSEPAKYFPVNPCPDWFTQTLTVFIVTPQRR